MIRLNEVSKRYSSDVVIGPVSLDLPAGGIIGLVGPNGAGKSTLLTMMEEWWSLGPRTKSSPMRF